MLDKIRNFFEKPENIILFISGLIFILLSLSLFISNFNLLKLMVFLILIFDAFLFGLIIYFQRKPKEETVYLFSFLQDLLDHLNEAIIIYDQDFRIKFVNQALTRLVNLKKENLLNLIVEQSLIKNKEYEMLADVFFPFFQGEELKIINREPEIIEVKFSKPKEKYLLIGYFNITLDKAYKLRVILDKTEDVIESKRKLEFVQLVSHNLLTPLNTVRWSLEAINLERIPSEDREFIETALKTIKNSLVFITSIFTFLRTESGRLELNIEEVDLEKIFVYILDIFKEQIEEKRLKVNVEISERVQFIPGDRNLLLSSFFSLIENAVLYNKPGGSIFIETRKQEGRPYIQVTIKDTGIGMSEEDLRNLFKKYYRGEKAKELEVKGFGFGLYLAKKIIDLHGGEIKIESQENKGTDVTILLPIDKSLIPILQPKADSVL